MSRKIFSHHQRGHDLGYVETGRDFRRLYVEGNRIEVGKSDYYHVMESKVMCYTCDEQIGDGGDITEWL